MWALGRSYLSTVIVSPIATFRCRGLHKSAQSDSSFATSSMEEYFLTISRTLSMALAGAITRCTNDMIGSPVVFFAKTSHSSTRDDSPVGIDSWRSKNGRSSAMSRAFNAPVMGSEKRWSQIVGQNFRVYKWSLCRVMIMLLLQFEVVKVHRFRSLTTMFGMRAALIVEREVLSDAGPRAYSTRFRSPIPRQNDHRFQRISIADSTANRSLIL